MATETKLTIKFDIGNNKVTTFNFRNAKTNLTSSQAETAAQAIITNGSIFKKVPLTVKDIKLITTNTTDLDS